jgi:hypothetical protein
VKRISHALLFVCLFPATASAADTGTPAVDVCIGLDTPVKPELLLWSELTAGQIYARIGVRLRWSCGPDAIRARLSDRTPEGRLRGALAYALPFARSGVRVTVFYDRCEPYLDGPAVIAGRVLGHVLAHEIGHILTGEDAHADTGVMRAQWGASDFQEMRTRPLDFTRLHAGMIRESVARISRTQASAP